MPLYRRVARRGFSNSVFKKEYAVVSLDVISANFEDGDVVTLDALKDVGLAKGHNTQAKVLCNGELTKKVIIDGLKVSATAIEKITAAGGEIK
jgi:large subunit ribosomal protein L15